MKKIVIIGAGGHAKVIIDIILQRQKYMNDNLIIEGILDDKFDEFHEIKIFGIPIIGKIAKIAELSDEIFYIISIGNNSVRKKISESYRNIKYAILVHPKSIIGENVIIEEGTVVMAGAVVNTHVKIGKHCILNTGSVVEHDSILEDYVHISPKAVLCGGVCVGEETWIGAGATVIQEMKIGKGCTIGAGSVVNKMILDYSTAVGVPARVIKVKE